MDVRAAEQPRGSLRKRLVDLVSDELRRRQSHHRPERRRGMQGVAEDGARREFDERANEVVEQRLVDVDALDRATRLPGVEERAIDEFGRRFPERCITPDIGRILAAQLEIHGPGRRDVCDRGHRT